MFLFELQVTTTRQFQTTKSVGGAWSKSNEMAVQTIPREDATARPLLATGTPPSPCLRLADAAAQERQRCGRPVEPARPVRAEQNSCLYPRHRERARRCSLNRATRRGPYVAHRPRLDWRKADSQPADGSRPRPPSRSGRFPTRAAKRRARSLPQDGLRPEYNRVVE